ncbi:MAG: four helix bundle protein [Patescibacteria group bacterium]
MLDIKKRTKIFSIEIIKLVAQFSWKNPILVVLGKQLLRSATSVSANLVEGSGSVSDKEFINFLAIARKSSLETQHWLDLIVESKTLPEKIIQPFQKEAIEIGKILTTSLKNNKKKTLK